MNRHAPLFRVALISLSLAIALPLLVFLASQVRHRQLQSTANPRWKAFKEVNGSQLPPALVANSNLAESQPEPRSADSRWQSKADSWLPAKTVSQPKGLTGSATGETPRNSMPTVSIPNRIAPLQTAELERNPSSVTVPMHVPQPDDLSGSEDSLLPGPQRSTIKPKVEFRTLTESEVTARRIESQLAGMQRRLDQLAQLQTEKQSTDLERLLTMLQQSQQNQQSQQLPPSPLETHHPQPFTPPPVTPQLTLPPKPATPQGVPDHDPGRGLAGNGTGREPSIKIFQGDVGDNDERFSIQVQDANLTEVLEMLAQLSGVNILTSRDVQGRVSLNLQDVTVAAALEAILKSQGFVYEREGDFVYVRTPAEAAAIRQANRKLITKVYQLRYISAGELQKLIDPVLTNGVGRQAVTSPPQNGIGAMPNNVGGDGLAGRDTLLVQDYPEVIAEIDRIVIELDVPPLQVLIEAKILSVALTENMAFGVNFAMLNGAHDSQMLSGNGTMLNYAGFPANGCLVPPAGDFNANTAGLKYGFISGDATGFITALGSLANATLVAAPQVRVLNKQKAEMIIGERLSYKTLAFNGAQTMENVQFLDAGTRLIVRPFISPDGLVRLEVHPERSRATINEQTGLPNSETTEVTSSFMVRDGTTVVLGGLIYEETTDWEERVPILGAIPLVGHAFRSRITHLQRNELIVLLTPRIVTESEYAIDGEILKSETRERATDVRDDVSTANRGSVSHAHYERACAYCEQGNLLKAKQQVEAALVQNKTDQESQRLKLKIDQALCRQPSRAWRWPIGGYRTANR